MNFKPISLVNVFFVKGMHHTAMGRLALKNRRIFFEYTPEFIRLGLEPSPFHLPLKPGVHVCSDPVFEGVFGLFNDSLPDGWGRLLLDRKLLKNGIHPNTLSPLDRLCCVGSNSMGALVYKPEISDQSPFIPHDLDQLEEEALAIQRGAGDTFIDDLMSLNGSSSGARPKINLTIDQDTWLIKFRSSLDLVDSGPIEYAYHLMAKDAGLVVPTAQLFASQKGPGYFGVQRFDRTAGQRQHIHTISGLLHADHRIPSLDYETIMKATLWLTKDVRECEQQFTVAIFNILSHNRDDHAKNFSFIMGDTGMWHVSPSYDLTFSSGPAGEHSTIIMGEGKSPQLDHALKLAAISSIKKDQALALIEKVRIVTNKWECYASEANVSMASRIAIHKTLQRVHKHFFNG